jgi:transketolase
MMTESKTMRDVFIETLYQRMATDPSLFFLAADFGSPKLDRLRADHPDRFVNVGIAEQNLVNVATGLALEGFTVYAYAIAPFLTMRAYEQIRNNLSLLSHTHLVNVNLVGVGGGLSYDVSGPTHHSLEDLGIMRMLPNMTVLSPSDWVLAGRFVDHTISSKGPKYLRFDGKPLPNLYDPSSHIDIHRGFIERVGGSDVCIVSTGYMTRTAEQAIERLAAEGHRPGLIDVFLLKPLPEQAFFDAIRGYRHVVTVEEGFAGKGGLDTLVASILNDHDSSIGLTRIGFGDAYVFDMGTRDSLHARTGIGADRIVTSVKAAFRGMT